MAKVEERKGAKIFVGNNKLIINEKWFWDEEKEEKLRDKMSKIKKSGERKDSGEGEKSD